MSTALEGGRVRCLTNHDGDVITERLVGFNEAERHDSYAIIEAPFPVDGYVSTLRVHTVPGRDDVAKVQWSGRFTPKGATEQEVVDLFTGICRRPRRPPPDARHLRPRRTPHGPDTPRGCPGLGAPEHPSR